MATVPCGKCQLCCKGRMLVLLRPQDDPALYETEPHEGGLRLKMKPNGDCIYLDKKGCSIHDHAPITCRVYDCRADYQRYNRKERRSLERKGILNHAVMRRGMILLKQVQ